MSTSLVWQPSRSTSPALTVAIARIDDTISLIVAYHWLTVRSLLLPSQQQLSCFSSSVLIPLCIVSTPPKKGPQHCGLEVREEREAHLHYSGSLIFSFGIYYARCRPPLLQQLQSQLQPSPVTTASLFLDLSLLAVKRQSLVDIEAGDF
ncbi:hypothetical protein B296_00042016 [Ensete ventricosum]|uniref:Uncharacterized protein n=1 Tax=Ensete ventricosum TaxID=4639 RepID=A0A426X1U8_ENSVE|nr:hypothetical protein B296_00042016 [Ensete ventricosum]